MLANAHQAQSSLTIELRYGRKLSVSYHIWVILYDPKIFANLDSCDLKVCWPMYIVHNTHELYNYIIDKNYLLAIKNNCKLQYQQRPILSLY